jgi:hypothetical protein
LAYVLTATLQACDSQGGGSEPPPQAPYVTFIPASVRIHAGEHYIIGVSTNTTPAFSIDDPSIADILGSTSTTVTIRGLSEGSTTLRGQFDQVAGSASIMVDPPLQALGGGRPEPDV